MAPNTRKGDIIRKLELQKEISKLRTSHLESKTILSNICDEISQGKTMGSLRLGLHHPPPTHSLSDNHSGLSVPSRTGSWDHVEGPSPLEETTADEKYNLSPQNVKTLLSALKQRFREVNGQLQTFKSRNKELELQLESAKKEMKMKDLVIQKTELVQKTYENDNKELKISLEIAKNKSADLENTLKNHKGCLKKRDRLPKNEASGRRRRHSSA